MSNLTSLPDDDMPAEIDFSSGIRGFHHIPPTAHVILPPSHIDLPAEPTPATRGDQSE